MSHRNQSINEALGIVLGILLLFGMHAIAIVAIFLISLIIGQIFGNYVWAGIWVFAAYGFFLLQLLYVIPVTLLLKRQQRSAMIKGVIIGAVITALLNGACFLLFNN